MTKLPHVSIDLKAFHTDPYPTYAKLQSEAPIAFVPELDAVLFTRRYHITTYEKMIEVFSSEQPDGLMNILMGQNMMRRDGDAHLTERRAIFPTISPKTARDLWTDRFQAAADHLITDLKPRGHANLMTGFAAPLAGEALKIITGLTHVEAAKIDQWSQAMVEGIANYAGDPEIDRTCRTAVAEIDAAVVSAPVSDHPTLINSQRSAGLPEPTIAANIRLAISGGQNESRDAITGLLWALLTHPDQLALVRSGDIPVTQAFDEFVRWIAPIGMSPRRVTRPISIDGATIPKDARAFFMFAAANRDPETFTDPARFDITRDASRHIAFGAGPHFCAGAPIAKALVAQVALPTILRALTDLDLRSPVNFSGWAFRGPNGLNCRWTA